MLFIEFNSRRNMMISITKELKADSMYTKFNVEAKARVTRGEVVLVGAGDSCVAIFLDGNDSERKTVTINYGEGYSITSDIKVDEVRLAIKKLVDEKENDTTQLVAEKKENAMMSTTDDLSLPVSESVFQYLKSKFISLMGRK